MHDGMEVKEKTGFVQGRVTSSPNRRPAPKYYETARGTSLPASFGPDELKKAVETGVVRLVSAPQHPTGPAPVTIVNNAVLAPAPECPPAPSTVLDLREIARLEYEDALREIEYDDAIRDMEDSIREMGEAEQRRAAAALEEEVVHLATSQITAEGALEDLCWSLKNQRCHLTDGEGNVISGLKIVRS